MTYDDAFLALSEDVLKFVCDGQTIGLGSGRAATAFVKILAIKVKEQNLRIKCIPTSLQIKIIAQNEGLELIEADQIEELDYIFDGADQIDSDKFLVKGGGGALLRENILINSAKKAVILADETKFVKNLNMDIPIEIHPLARMTVTKKIIDMDGKPKIRSLQRGYPFITENGNIILDCNFGVIEKPLQFRQKISKIAGVLEIGVFSRKPDIIYKAKKKGKFEIIK